MNKNTSRKPKNLREKRNRKRDEHVTDPLHHTVTNKPKILVLIRATDTSRFSGRLELFVFTWTDGDEIDGELAARRPLLPSLWVAYRSPSLRLVVYLARSPFSEVWTALCTAAHALIFIGIFCMGPALAANLCTDFRVVFSVFFFSLWFFRRSLVA